MSKSSNAATVRSLIQRFFNSHDPSVATEYFTPDFKWHGGSVGSYNGAENYAVAMAGFFRGLPDVLAFEQGLIESGDTVAARFIVEGTHLGELWGVQPTGRRIRWEASMVYQMVGGKVAEQWAAEDWAAILHQMGVVQLPWLK